MAYKTEIQIGVKGTAALDKLRKNIGDLNEKVNLIDKGFRTGIQSLARYERALSKAADTLQKVRAKTADERTAIRDYVSILLKSNAARERQNKLIDQQIRKQKELARIARQSTGFTAAQYGPQPAAGFDPTAGASRVRTALAEHQSIKEINQRRMQERALLTEQINNDLKYAQARLKSNDKVFKDMIAKDKQALQRFDQELTKRTKAKQTARANRGKQAENLMLGAGFPLLFGGGVGQVAGGLAGSFVGTGFGGQIIGSAVGQILEDALIRIREIGTAARSLDMDALRNSVIFVNAELDTTVRRLIEAGKAQEAQNVLAAALTEQTGLSAESIERTTNNTNRLANEWEGVTAAYSGYLTLLGEPLVDALSKGLGLQSQLKVNTEEAVPIVRNLALSYLGIPPALLQGLGLAKQNQEQAKVLNEEEQKRLALLTTSNDRLSTKIKNTQAIASLEAKRILATSIADKEHNAQLDYEIAQEKIRQEFAEKVRLARVQTAGLVGEEVEKRFTLLEQEKQQALNAATRTHELKMQALELDKQREKHKQMLEDIKLQKQLLEDQAQSLNYQGQIISNNTNLVNARRQTESDLLSLQISRLERQKDEAKHFLDKIKFNNLIIDKTKQQAKLEYEAQLSSIKLSVSKAEQERLQIRLKEQQLKLALEQTRLEAQSIEDADRREAALDRINAQEKSTLQVVYDMNRAANHSLETTRKIASFQQQSAKYAYQGKIEALETAREQERTAILLNSQKSSMSSLASQSGQYASNMERAASAAGAAGAASKQKSDFDKGVLGATKTSTISTSIPIDKDIQEIVKNRSNRSVEEMVSRMEEMQKERNRSQLISATRARQSMQKPSYSVYAAGGYVTKPHVGMVGEAGPEYIVPERKAAAFATNYLMGARGSSAIPRYAEGGYVGPVNIQTGPVMQQGGTNYVTMDQFERGLMDLATAVSASNRSYGARQYMGVQR